MKGAAPPPVIGALTKHSRVCESSTTGTADQSPGHCEGKRLHPAPTGALSRLQQVSHCPTAGLQIKSRAALATDSFCELSFTGTTMPLCLCLVQFPREDTNRLAPVFPFFIPLPRLSSGLRSLCRSGPDCFGALLRPGKGPPSRQDLRPTSGPAVIPHSAHSSADCPPISRGCLGPAWVTWYFYQRPPSTDSDFFSQPLPPPQPL